jgi:hypothetical protein
VPSHTFYVDEAGNAGINYLDEEQPFHVAAGIIVANEQRDELRAVYKQHCGRGPEIKAAKRLGSNRGRRVIAETLQSLGALGAVPFFVVMDRKFSLVGKLIDIFLDPEHHDAVDWLPTHAIQMRNEITEALYEHLSAEVLSAFAIAYRVPSEDGFRQVLDMVIEQLEARGDRRLSTAFIGAREAVARIVEWETYGDANGKHSDWAALNLPALTHLTRMADRYMTFRDARYSVIHDRNVQFAKMFTHSVSTISLPEYATPDWVLPDGTVYRVAFTHLDDFSMLDSRDEPLLRAADMLASTVSRVAREALRSPTSNDPTFAPLAKLTMPALMETDEYDNPTFAGAYAHRRVTAAMIMVAMRGGLNGTD